MIIINMNVTLNPQRSNWIIIANWIALVEKIITYEYDLKSVRLARNS